MSALLELAERCEAATGPDRKLDAEIAVATGEQSQARELLMAGRKEGEERGPYDLMVRYYTTSVDAALTLVPEGYGIGCGNMNPSNCRFNAWVMPPPYNLGADIRTGETLALAICAAALRARAA